MKSNQYLVRRASRFQLLLWHLLIGACLTSFTASACLRWVQRTDVGSPGPRYAHSLAYDPRTGLVVFFGGQFSEVGGEPEFFNDVWTYDGIRWTKVDIIGPSPSPRSWASFAAWNGQLRLGRGIGYGGVEESEWHLELLGFGTGLWTQYPSFPVNDRWEPRGFQGNGGIYFGRTEIAGVRLPVGNKNFYDSKGVRFPSGHELAGRPLLMGGGTGPDGGNNFSDPEVQAGGLLEFTPNGNFTAWVSLSTGPRPQNRAQHVAAFDTNRNRVVLFGGAGIQGAERYWELAKVNNQYQWQRMDWIGNIPEGRAHAQMVYDERRKVTVLFGGIGGPGFARFGDTWELVSVPPETFVFGATNIDRCLDQASPTYLSSSFNGASPFAVQWFFEDLGKTYAIDDATNTTFRVNEWPGTIKYFYTVRDGCDNLATSAVYSVTSHQRPRITVFTREEACPGDEVELKATIASTRPSNFQWYHNGRPIGAWVSLDAGIFQPALVLTNVQPTNAGYYTLVGYNECGYATNFPTDLEDKPVGLLRVGPTILEQTGAFSSPVGGVGGAGVLADGTGRLHYQWRLDGVPVTNDTHTSGANTNEIFLRGVRHNQRGNYDVIVWDDCGRQYAVTSSIVKHTVFPGPDWLIRTNPGPSARYRHTMAYDSGRHVTVLFGGYFNTPTNLTSYNDLWEWDGMRWLRRTTNSLAGWELNPANGGWRPSYSGVPVGRAEHAMAYDPKRGRVVIFGGAGIDPNGVSHNLNDTWEWDGAQWAFRGTNGPGWRSGAGMAYDSQRQVIGLYGGVYSSAEVLRGEFWEWNGVEWKIRPTFGNISAFANTISMTYDAFRNQFVYGPTFDSLGTFIDNFWILKGSNWTSHGRAFNNRQNPASYGSLVYDSDRRRSTYTFGTLGHSAIGDGASWEMITNTPAPAMRFWHASAYDSDRLVVVLFGGTFGFNQYYSSTNDTWELTYVDVPQIRAHPGSQVRQVNEFAEFTVDVIGHAPLSYQWLRNGVPMANDARISGVNTNVLRISNITSNDAALYQVRVENACGTALSRPAFLTLNPNLQILSGAGEISVLWDVSNSVLEQADNINGPWIPIPGASNPFNPGMTSGMKLFRLRQLP